MTEFHRVASLLLPSLFAVTACGDPAPIDLGGNYQVTVSRAPLVNPNIDLLFVVDNSGSMADSVAQVGALAQRTLIDIVAQAISQRPNLHVGVVTSDLGCGGGNEGEDGIMAPSPACGLDDGAKFLTDNGAPGDAHAGNYQGELGDALACMTNVGTTGCGLEQPLGAVVRAIDGTRNPGFVRDEAILVVVVLTDEDDCTAASDALFTSTTSSLGPLHSFRCFEFGTVCDQANDDLGEHTGCMASPDDQLLTPLERLRNRISAAKGGDPTNVFLANIAAGPAHVSVRLQDDTELFPGALTLDASCTYNAGDQTATATPSIRLHDLAQQMAGQSWEESICVDDLELSLRRTGNAIGDIVGARACVHGDLFDADATRAGLQPNCRAFAVDAPFTAAQVRTEIRRCTSTSDDRACFTLVNDQACAHTTSGLRAEISPRGQPELTAKHVVVECLITDSTRSSQ